MIKCLECGYETNRLQWSHFKYKCTGKYKSSKEYLKAHPGAKLVSEELAKKTAVTLENLTKKYGKDEGNKRWEDYKEKQSYTNTFEYKAKSKGWTKNQYDEFNKSRAVTIENLVLKYGEAVGLQKWDEYCEKQRYTNSLEYFEKKYGLEGDKKWRKYCKEKGKSTSLDYVMEKHSCNEADAIQILSSRYTPNFISNTEKVFVDEIIKVLGDIKYTYKTSQFGKWSTELNSIVFYDIVCSEKKKVIEYNGDYWHCNPSKYNDDFVVSQNGMTAREIRKRDMIKIDTIKSAGYDVKIIWESDFQTNPKKTINEIKQWWMN